MLQFDVSAEARKGLGKGKNRQIRFAGRTPAVLYGCGVESQALSVDTRQVTKDLISIHGRPAVLNLTVDGKDGHHVLVRDLQVHPVTDTLMHLDFYKIDVEKLMVFAVPVEYTGIAKGVDLGGELQVLSETVNLKGKPLEIPDTITIDISDLGMHDAFTFSDLVLPDTVELMDAADDVCVRVIVATVVEEEVEEEEEEEEAASEVAEEATAE